MRYASNIKIIQVLKMLKSMTPNNNNIIINNNFNSFTNGLNNKSLENKKRNKNTNILIIILKSDFIMT